MILLDTSFVIALLDKKDSLHSRAKKIFQLVPEDEDLAVHYLVRQESYTVTCRRSLEKGKDPEKAISILESFFASVGSLSDLPNEKDVLSVMREAGCELSYVDAALVLLSEKLSSQVLTLDEKLKKHLGKGRFFPNVPRLC